MADDSANDQVYRSVMERVPIVYGLGSDDKLGVYNVLLDALVSAGQLPGDQRDTAFAALCERDETGGGTALMNGVAVPHCRLDTVPDLAVAIGLHVKGLECGAFDGLPTMVFILVVAPPSKAQMQMHFLASVTRRLLQSDVRRKVLIARDADTVRRLLLEG